MEKGIEVVARYQYRNGYFVEVSQERSAITDTDYWLCKQGSMKKMFMFSTGNRGREKEEELILKNIREQVRRYEQSSAGILPA